MLVWTYYKTLSFVTGRVSLIHLEWGRIAVRIILELPCRIVQISLHGHNRAVADWKTWLEIVMSASDWQSTVNVPCSYEYKDICNMPLTNPFNTIH